MTDTTVAAPDPITTEVIGAALASICEEMGEALVKASFSPNIKERRDCTTSLFDPQGRSLAQAEHIPLHLGSLMGIVDAIRQRYPLDDIREGDSFVGNDPHTGGGTHLPDIVVATPVFVDGELVAWATNLAHHADYADRGHATIFQEGIRIPAVRFATADGYIDDVLHLILTNMQVPTERLADFSAQLAANRLGVRRYAEICRRYGTGVVAAAGSALMDYSERMVRIGISRIPDGVYPFRDTFDSDELDEALDVGVEITVAGDTVRLVFDGPDQHRSSINMVRTALLATVYYAMKSLVGPDIPANAGLYRPIEVQARSGSVFSCVAPAAVNGRTQLCQRVVDLVHGALAPAVPEQVLAASYGSVPAVQFSGTDPRTGQFYVYLETIGGGYGGGSCQDGLDGVQAHITNTSNLPIECLESEYPITVERYELVDGSAGSGTFRGGMGIRRQLRIEHDDCLCDVSVSRVASRPWGLFGGRPGAALAVTRNGSEPVTRTVTTLNRGDVITVDTAGGGGYGDPALRSAEDVGREVLQGRLTAEAAAADYGWPGP
ncbi:hydantoinase B/oxoprolinase family protein [Nakamurella sp. YIM 132087]|uniref:Hydantoinase B/oxoprolinase family protein n=1 Tax=Nakamurella alba TaxID=2665158 RepID=A0A7K1FQ46_9ACTN|nr:hydantoinase B/oxoprolinase family protein [Nakamurella alba]MTD16272.1 hydantoinase B/oxoprolinase family protein [Nakamurella alba]